MHAGRHDPLVNFRHRSSVSGVSTGHHLDDLGERAFLVAGIDAFRRIADKKIRLPFQTGLLSITGMQTSSVAPG